MYKFDLNKDIELSVEYAKGLLLQKAVENTMTEGEADEYAKLKTNFGIIQNLIKLRIFTSGGVQSVQSKDSLTSFAMVFVDQGYVDAEKVTKWTVRSFYVEGSLLSIEGRKMNLTPPTISMLMSQIKISNPDVPFFSWQVGDKVRVVGPNYLGAVFVNLGIDIDDYYGFQASKLYFEYMGIMSPSRKDLDEADQKAMELSAKSLGRYDFEIPRIVDPTMRMDIMASLWEADSFTKVEPSDMSISIATIDIGLGTLTQTEEEIVAWFSQFIPYEFELRRDKYLAEKELWTRQEE